MPTTYHNAHGVMDGPNSFKEGLGNE